MPPARVHAKQFSKSLHCCNNSAEWRHSACMLYPGDILQLTMFLLRLRRKLGAGVPSSATASSKDASANTQDKARTEIVYFCHVFILMSQTAVWRTAYSTPQHHSSCYRRPFEVYLCRRSLETTLPLLITGGHS